jgi:hypothetical protein
VREKAARPHDPDRLFTLVRFKSLAPHPLPWLAAHGALCNKPGAQTIMKRSSKLIHLREGEHGTGSEKRSTCHTRSGRPTPVSGMNIEDLQRRSGGFPACFSDACNVPRVNLRAPSLVLASSSMASLSMPTQHPVGYSTSIFFLFAPSRHIIRSSDNTPPPLTLISTTPTNNFQLCRACLTSSTIAPPRSCRLSRLTTLLPTTIFWESPTVPANRFGLSRGCARLVQAPMLRVPRLALRPSPSRPLSRSRHVTIPSRRRARAHLLV